MNSKGEVDLLNECTIEQVSENEEGAMDCVKFMNRVHDENSSCLYDGSLFI